MAVTDCYAAVGWYTLNLVAAPFLAVALPAVPGLFRRAVGVPVPAR